MGMPVHVVPSRGDDGDARPHRRQERGRRPGPATVVGNDQGLGLDVSGRHQGEGALALHVSRDEEARGAGAHEHGHAAVVDRVRKAP